MWSKVFGQLHLWDIPCPGGGLAPIDLYLWIQPFFFSFLTPSPMALYSAWLFVSFSPIICDHGSFTWESSSLALPTTCSGIHCCSLKNRIGNWRGGLTSSVHRKFWALFSYFSPVVYLTLGVHGFQGWASRWLTRKQGLLNFTSDLSFYQKAPSLLPPRN